MSCRLLQQRPAKPKAWFIHDLETLENHWIWKYGIPGPSKLFESKCAPWFPSKLVGGGVWTYKVTNSASEPCRGRPLQGNYQYTFLVSIFVCSFECRQPLMTGSIAIVALRRSQMKLPSHVIIFVVLLVGWHCSRDELRLWGQKWLPALSKSAQRRVNISEAKAQRLWPCC